MKHFHLPIFVVSIFLLTANSQPLAGPPSYTTADVFNGRMWQLLSDAQKISHLTGIQEGIILCLNQIKADLNIPRKVMDSMKAAGVVDRRRLLFSSQGITAIETRINTFYKMSENIDIPIIEAYRHVTLEMNFAEPHEVANNLSTLRRKYGK
jgi:hypothetical protein